ncbi:MAG: cytochrome b N-terminal domain-containing protein [Bryobacteraceae bacterium]|nr:cytochrome b N-terminal domain-containing protein [Bryobacteraceae bacterium]
MIRQIVDWLEERTGIESAIQSFLYEEIPGSSGWHQVFGSVAAFLFMLQVFTGIMLAFNYAPTPGEAYNSLKYIMLELTGGSLMRGLHHWGASLMIVIVVMHMCQVFLWGAYKKPREATWILGVVLLLITFAFGLTGYLLPWDNRAYWGTVVTTKIAASAPFAGPYLERLMGSDGSIGVVTFTRFYAAHVLLLPPLTMILIALHIFLVRKHGVAPAAIETAPPKKFYPEQVYKDTVAIFGAFVLLFVLAVAAKVPLERLADPTDTSYIPKPDWYFLFLYELLKFFPGSLEIVGSVILPSLAILGLFAVPFLDRAKLARVRQRTVAIGVLILSALIWTGLTVQAVVTSPKPLELNTELLDAPQQPWQEMTPEEVAGIGYYRRENCAGCHSPGKIGPDLTRPTARKTASWMIEHFKHPQELVPGSSMPPIHLTDAQLNTLAAFLLRLTPQNASVIETTPAFAVDGAILYQKQQCGGCHVINGSGQKLGPGLNGVALRRSKAWIEGHFLNPEKFSPDSPMPPYKFKPKDMEAITSYLLALPKI